MAFNGRRESQFPNIDGLNTIPSEWDVQNITSNVDDDLSMFTSGEFNFDMPEMNYSPYYPPGDMSQPTSAHPSHVQPAFPPAAAASSQSHDYTFQNYRQFHDLPGAAASVAGNGDAAAHNSMSPATSEKPDLSSHSAEKRKSVALADIKPVPADEDARAAAEEDKRRRNTAASARFRVKKKQREQAMEKTAKEMTDRVTHLENKVSQLESENKILRGLLTDKVGNDAAVAELTKTIIQSDAKQSKADGSR